VTTAEADRHAVIEAVRRINQAWLSEQPRDAIDLFDPAVVFVAPDFLQRKEGREACLDSYQQFVVAAKVGWFHESDWQVDVTGDVAVATYAWEITYEMDGALNSERGHDLFVFRRDPAGWLATWRMVRPSE